MNVIFMGTPDFAAGTLKALLFAGHTVTLAVTRPDKRRGRGHAMQYTPVKETALAHGIAVFQPTKIRDAEAVRRLEETQADVIVVVAYGQMLPESVLKMKPYGCVNVHASLLPKYRGAAPIQWAVINGEKESGVTTMQMDAGLDTGDILLSAAVPLEEKETGGSLFDKLSAAGARLCVETLRGLEEGTIQPKKQGDSPTAYAFMLTKEMGEIDWSKDAATIERLARGLNPWPSAYTRLNGKTLKIWECEAVLPDVSKGAYGEIMSVTKDSLVVRTGNGALAVKELQIEGRKRMGAGDFLRGFPVEAGTILGLEKEDTHAIL